jgi:hypothetical protein
MKKKHKEITSVEFTFGSFFGGRSRLSVISGFEDGSATWSMSTPEGYSDKKMFGDLDKSRWDEFRKSLVEKANVLSWKESYVDPYILDGFQWDLNINFSDGKTLEIGGSNDYPKEWAELNSIMAELTGLKDEFSKNEAEDDLEDFEEYYKKEEE